MDYVRKNKKPLLLEAKTSRLYGHSSADGANKRDAECPIETFERKLIRLKVITKEKCDEIRKSYDDEARAAMEQVRQEPVPSEDSIWDHVYADNENGDWRKF